MHKPILVAGIPRTGSSWFAEILAKADNAIYLHEPDNEKLNFSAWNLKKNLHRYPYLRKDRKSADYLKLWEEIFSNGKTRFYNNEAEAFQLEPHYVEYQIGKKCKLVHETFFKNNCGGRFTTPFFISRLKELLRVAIYQDTFRQRKRTDKRLIIKSVHCILALEWLCHNFDIDIVVIVRRPANIIASCLELKLPDSMRNIFSQRQLIEDYFKHIDPDRLTTQSIIQAMAVQIGAFYYILEQQQKNYDWIIVKHEDMCTDTQIMCKTVFDKLGLSWNKGVEKHIARHDDQGSGFNTFRLAESLPDKYRLSFSPGEIEEIKKYYGMFNNRLYD